MKRIFNTSFFAMLLLVMGWGYSAQASHYLGSELTYTCLGNHQYEVQLVVYTDCAGVMPALNQTVNMSASCATLTAQLPIDGSATDITPLCPGQASSCNGQSGPYGVWRAVYKGTVTLPTAPAGGGCSDWVLSHGACCRTGMGTAIMNGASQSHHVSAFVDDSQTTCNSSPKFLDNEPVRFITTGDTVMTSFAATDADGDSLVYSFAPAYGNNGTALTYNTGFGANAPFGTPAVIDAATGAVIIAPISVQQSNTISVMVEEYRNGVKIGSVLREITYFVTASNNNAPRVSSFNFNAITTNTFTVNHVVDPNNLDSLPLFFTIADANSNSTLSVRWDNLPAGASTSMPQGNPFFFWTPTLADVGLHTINLTVMDNGCPSIGQSTYVIQINVTAVPSVPAGNTYYQYDTIVAGGTSMLCLDVSNFSGTLASTTVVDSILTNATLLNIFMSPCSVFQGDSIATDSMTFILCNTQGTCDTFIQVVTVEQGVWPGDTDTDMMVDNNDLLPIGIAYGATGLVRDTASIIWSGYRARDWGQLTPSSAVDFKHIDADGNGTINADDTLAITLNWGNSYSFRNRGGVRGTIPFFVDVTTPPTQQQAQLPIVLGSQSIPANGVYGLAFTLQYDTSLVKPGTVNVSFANSWIGSIGTDMISIQRDFYPDGIVKVAVTRTDGQNMNGFGPIGTLGFTIQDDIMLQRGNYDFRFDLRDVRLINAQETELGTNPTESTLSITTSTQQLALDRISVFPNPATNWLRVEAQNTVIEDVIMLTVAGQTIRTWHPATDQTTLKLEDVTPGLYILSIRTSEGLLHKKVRID